MQDLNKLINQAAELLRQANHAVAMTGAGHSTHSGIPDFRSPDSGLWPQVDPIAVASLFAFRLRPQEFYNWIRPVARLVLEAEPNPAHAVIAEMDRAYPEFLLATQNVDGLHRRAGSERLVELHGNLHRSRCTGCDEVSGEATAMSNPALTSSGGRHCVLLHACAVTVTLRR